MGLVKAWMAVLSPCRGYGFDSTGTLAASDKKALSLGRHSQKYVLQEEF
jgi:hypothetical protein